MTDGATLWLIIYSLAALTFFMTAAVIAFLGARDLRDLLRRSARSRENQPQENRSQYRDGSMPR